MSQSILQISKHCYITGSEKNLQKHHILPGNGRRAKSEKYGLWVWLTADMHNKIHNDPKYTHYRYELEADAQTCFEGLYGHERWMQEFHKNYL